MELLNILPNLSIGVVSVIALVYVTLKFLQHIDEKAKTHAKAMTDREVAIRELEKEIRMELSQMLSKSAAVIAENNKLLDHIVRKGKIPKR